MFSNSIGIKFNSIYMYRGSRDSVVDTATVYGLEGQSSSTGTVKIFLFSTSPRRTLGFTQPPIQCVGRIKGPGRGADHSPPASAKVKKMWIYTSTYASMA
jgi:hypothetical protein